MPKKLASNCLVDWHRRAPKLSKKEMHQNAFCIVRWSAWWHQLGTQRCLCSHWRVAQLCKCRLGGDAKMSESIGEDYLSDDRYLSPCPYHSHLDPGTRQARSRRRAVIGQLA